jgi:hypothetical protein
MRLPRRKGNTADNSQELLVSALEDENRRVRLRRCAFMVDPREVLGPYRLMLSFLT